MSDQPNPTSPEAQEPPADPEFPPEDVQEAAPEPSGEPPSAGAEPQGAEASDAPVESVELRPEDLPQDLLGQLGLDSSPEDPVTVNPATFGNLTPQANGHTRRANLEMLLDIGLQVTVELGRTKMTIKNVLGLGPGAVIELDRVAGEPVDVLVNGKPVAKGEVVVIGDMFGVRITDIIPPSQRMAHLL